MARALSVATFAFASYLFLLWARRPSREKDLALALLFAAMGLYDVFVSRLYAVELPRDAIHWLRLAAAADNLVALLFIWYISEFTGLVSRPILLTWVGLFGLFAVAELTVPGDFAWVAERPIVFSVELPLSPVLTFRLVSSGPLGILDGLAGLAFAGHCAYYLWKRATTGKRRGVLGMAVALVAVALALLNDVLVGQGLYRFIFLTEYAWSGAIVFLSYHFADEILAGDEALKRLDKSEARLRAMVEHVPFNIWMCDAQGRLIMQNSSDVATVGDHVGELYSQWTGLDERPSLFLELYGRALAGELVESSVSYEVAGEKRHYRDILSPVRSGDEIIGTVGVGIDITEQVRAAEEQKVRLAEKEVLLREIHHRVKNNLQVIASLVSLRAEEVEDLRSKEAFSDVQRQVYAIAHVHESLYLSDNLATIDFGEYLRKLADELFALQGKKGVERVLELESLFLDIETAIPCALIANELITNSLKHAFKGRDAGRLTISLREAEGRRAELTVEDDGPGIPESPAPGMGLSLGMVLVSSLAAQLRGALVIDGPRHNRLRISFPLD